MSRVVRNESDPRVRLYDILVSMDPQGSGIVTADDFDAAVEGSGMVFGSDESDKLMSQIAIMPDGSVDFWRWAEDMESLLSTPQIHSFHARQARTTDGNAAFQEEYKEKAIKQRNYILGQKDKIYRAFCHFEAGSMRINDFVAFLHECGVDDSQELGKLLREKMTCGQLSFAELLRTCTLPGRELSKPTVRVEQDPIVWDTQSRSTDVIAWREQAPMTRREPGLHRSQISYVPETGVNMAAALKRQGDLDGHQKTPAEKLRQERLYAVVRDFTQQKISAPAFRAALHDMGTAINDDLDVLIGRHASDSSISFKEFIRVMNLNDVFTLHAVVSSTEPARAAGTHGDLIGWQHAGEIPIVEPKASTRRHRADQPREASLWRRDDDDPRVPEPEDGWFTHRQKRHVTSSGQAPSAQSFVEHNDLLAFDENYIEPEQPETESRKGRRQLLAQQHRAHGDIFGWNNEPLPDEAETVTGLRQTHTSMYTSTAILHHEPDVHPEAAAPPKNPNWRQETLRTRPW